MQLFIYKSKPNFYPDSAMARPIVATKIAELISLFSRTELYHLQIVSRCVGLSESLAFSILASQNTEKGKIDTSNALLLETIGHAGLKEYQKLYKKIGSLRKTRNKLAHYLFGLAESEPDSILIVDPIEFTTWYRKADEDDSKVPDELMKIYVVNEAFLDTKIIEANAINRELMLFMIRRCPELLKSNNEPN